MKEMAEATNEGLYFRATNKGALEEIFEKIDKMEKSKIDVTKYAQTKDEFALWLMIAFIALVLEALIKWGWFKL
jgi:Ca-activated chloride channel family protein